MEPRRLTVGVKYRQPRMTVSQGDRGVILEAAAAGATFSDPEVRAIVEEHHVACARRAAAIYRQQQAEQMPRVAPMPGIKIGSAVPELRISSSRDGRMLGIPIGRAR